MPIALKTRPPTKKAVARAEDKSTRVDKSTIDRETLLKGLQCVAPALSSTSEMIETHHIWFDGKFASAFDIGLGIRVPLPTDFMGGVLGSTLLGLLASSSAKEVSLEAQETKHETSLDVRCGRSRATIPVLSPDRNPWQFPTTMPKGAMTMELSAELLSALKRVGVLKVSKPRRTEHYGVVVFPGRDDVELYTTNGEAMAQIVVKEKLSKDLAGVVLPHAFVHQIGKHGKVGDTITFASDCLSIDMAGVLVFSNLLDSSDVPDMPDTVNRLMTGKESIAKLPEDFGKALKRALVLVGTKETPYVDVEVRKKELALTGSYVFGDISEQFTLDTEGEEGKMSLNLPMLAVLAEESVEFAIGDRALILLGDADTLFLMAPHTKGEEG